MDTDKYGRIIDITAHNVILTERGFALGIMQSLLRTPVPEVARIYCDNVITRSGDVLDTWYDKWRPMKGLDDIGYVVDPISDHEHTEKFLIDRTVFDKIWSIRYDRSWGQLMVPVPFPVVSVTKSYNYTALCLLTDGSVYAIEALGSYPPRKLPIGSIKALSGDLGSLVIV